MTATTIDLMTEEVDCRPGGSREMKIVLTRPANVGVAPVVLDLHGGCWTGGGVDECVDRNRVMAEAGVVAAALDFRNGDARYPEPLADINYALRWLKANAGSLGIDAERVGLCGQSSGGHLAFLTAMRPNDPRYTAIPLDGGGSVDASVRCVGTAWPVINPLSRYRHALRARDAQPAAKWVSDLPERHDVFWGDEANMAEGNPMLALERKEAVTMPPAMWVQGRPDPMHDYRDPESPVDMNEPERFAANYEAAGGTIEIVDIDPKDRPASHAPLADFFRRQLT